MKRIMRIKSLQGKVIYGDPDVKDLQLETLQLYMQILRSLILALIIAGVTGRYSELFKNGITLKIRYMLEVGS